MITQTTAIVFDGVLHPEIPLQLPERSRVRLTIELESDIEKRFKAWQQFEARVREQPVNLGGRDWTREDLYDRD